MANLLGESVISLREAAGMLRCPLRTVVRFVEAGDGGVRLEAAGQASGRVTSVEAVYRFANERPQGRRGRAVYRPAGGFRMMLRVVIADDERSTADSLATLLRLYGHETRAVYDGEAALAVAGQWTPDAVLLDLSLPGMGGEELARRLRRLPGMGQSLLVCVSGFDLEEDRRRSQAAGCAHHLGKPVDPDTLLRVLACRA